VPLYLDNLQTVATTLQGMAEHQRTGTPHSQEQIDFINDAVRIESVDVGCAAVDRPTGWYLRLFYNRDDACQPAESKRNPTRTRLAARWGPNREVSPARLITHGSRAKCWAEAGWRRAGQHRRSPPLAPRNALK